MQHFPEKERVPDFSKKAEQKVYVHDTHSYKDLILKELDVNRGEQTLLKQRIERMSSFVNDLPSSDPQYSMIRIQVEMDKVEMDELRIRETVLLENLSKQNPNPSWNACSLINNDFFSNLIKNNYIITNKEIYEGDPWPYEKKQLRAKRR